ncbi:MAG: amidohydrolase [Eubacterium sp.]|nr:amidohydrolase [Eubacterium sp.]
MQLDEKMIVQAKAVQEDMVRVRREIHRTAETGLETFKTAEIITRELMRIGIPREDIRPMINGAAVTAMIYGKSHGKCIGLRADCDALPIREMADVPFKAENGNMHACGHDTHVAVVLGAAKLLYDNRQDLCCDVKLIFQPGEEVSAGAQLMIDEGVLEDPKVDCIVSFHSAVPGDSTPEFPCGSIGYFENMPVSACVGKFKVVFKGKSTHGGMSPHLGVDPVYMAASAVLQLQAIMTREKEPTERAVLSICRISAGNSFNIVPSEAEIAGTVRTFDKGLGEWILQRIREICTSVAEGLRGTAEFPEMEIGSAVTVDPAMMKQLHESAAKIVGEDHIYKAVKPMFAGEDFASFTDILPAAHFNHSVAFDDGTPMYPNHNDRFIVNEEKFYTGAATAARFILDWAEKIS